MKFRFVEEHRETFRIRKLCEVLQVSRSGFYAWLHRQPSGRAREDEAIAVHVREVHRRSREIYGSPQEAYVHWIRRFIRFSGGRHPRELGQPEIEAFLSHLAVDGNVAAATQNQALNAISFLYKRVLDRELGDLGAIVRAKKPRKLPVVLTRSEVMALLSRLDGVPRLASGLMYGAGLRLMETVRLRAKDLDLERGELVVRNGKGGRDRITVLPARLADPLRDQLAHARALHLSDLADGFGAVFMPDALARKYRGADRE